MLSLVQFLAGVLLALLPRQFRSRLAWASEANLHGPAIVSGLAETAVSLGLIIYRYFLFFEWRMGTIADAAIKRGAEEALGSMAVQFGSGWVVLVEYLLRPLTLLLIYFTIEGVVRVLAAGIGEECAGTLPLYLLASGLESLKKVWKEHRLGPRVPDLVQYCKGISYDLSIASCRPKPTWDRLMTIEYEDEFYELYEKKQGAPPRPYLYLLRKLTPGKVIRGLHHYHPDEALTEKQRKALARQAQP